MTDGRSKASRTAARVATWALSHRPGLNYGPLKTRDRQIRVANKSGKLGSQGKSGNSRKFQELQKNSTRKRGSAQFGASNFANRVLLYCSLFTYYSFTIIYLFIYLSILQVQITLDKLNVEKWRWWGDYLLTALMWETIRSEEMTLITPVSYTHLTLPTIYSV